MSNMNEWVEGERITPEFMTFRWIQGAKGHNDRKLLVGLPDRNGGAGWMPVSMVDVFFIHEFLCENEERLYPQEKGFSGWKYWVNALSHARKEGWQQARIRLHTQRAEKQDRLDG